MGKQGNKKVISIIGAGSWGSALSILLSQKHDIKMWSCFQDEVKMLNEKREHVDKLPGVSIPSNVQISTDVEYVLKDSDVVLLVVPSQSMRSTCKVIFPYVNHNVPIVSCAKGLENTTYLRMTQVIEEEIPAAKTAVLSGPSHAEEVARGIPTAVVVACKDMDIAKLLQDLYMTPRFRVYTHNDTIGVELGASIKNIIAICAGISDGLGFGDNTKSALMTRGVTEIARLGMRLGAQPQTFFGLSGIGDLFVTCASVHSRNRRAGILIGQGKSVDQAMKEVKMVVEGVATAQAAYHLANRMQISMPITEQAYKILFESKNPRVAVEELMSRYKKNEIDF